MSTDTKIKRRQIPNVFSSVINSWLEIVNLFQTFDDLESAKDKHAEIQAARQVLEKDSGD
jgi:hypothetical protein